MAAGGRMIQKINRDQLPVVAYDETNVRRLHVSIVNAEHLHHLTGLPIPPSPITMKTYFELGLPWLTFYDEGIPHANNTKVSTILSEVKSVATIDVERAMRRLPKDSLQRMCVYCTYQTATIYLMPCTHIVCDECAEGLDEDECPSCDGKVQRRERFEEVSTRLVTEVPAENGGASVLMAEKNIIALKRYAGTHTAISFKLPDHGISCLSGGWEISPSVKWDIPAPISGTIPLVQAQTTVQTQATIQAGAVSGAQVAAEIVSSNVVCQQPAQSTGLSIPEASAVPNDQRIRGGSKSWLGKILQFLNRFK